VSVYAIVPLTCFVIYALLAVISLRHPTRVRRLFALYLFAAMLWSISSSMAHADFTREHTFLWCKLLVIGGVPMLLFYYHFVCAFARKPGGIVLRLGYMAGAILIVLTALGRILQSAYFVEGTLYLDYGTTFYPVAIFNALFMGMSVFRLVQWYRGSVNPVERTRAVYLLVGICVFSLLGFTDLVPSLLKYPIDYVGAVFNAAIITYAILKYQLFDIRLVVRRGLVYSSLTVLITALYLLVLFIIQTYIWDWSPSGSAAVAIVLILLLAVLFNPLRNTIQEWVDRLFYRETYDYRQMLLRFSGRVSNILNLSELAQDMLYPITRALHVTWASLLVSDTQRGDFVTQTTETARGGVVAKLRFDRDNPVVTWLAGESKPLRRDVIEVLPEFKGLWEREKEELKILGVELFCPIKSKGDLVGILALGGKQSGAPYSNEDMDLLMTMSSSAAVAIENATVLGALKKQQLQVRELLAQTVRAQEDERKRMSVELHDSVTQWLVGASYRIQVSNALLSESDGSEARGELIRGELKEIESTIDQSLKELRGVMAGLHPPALAELGLPHAVRQLADRLENEGIAYSFETTGTPNRLPSSIEITIYRIVQESLANIRKHAEATNVVIRLCFQDEGVLVEVSDDGKGFSLYRTLDSAVSVGSMGLLGMKQRAETVGGTLDIETKPGGGTKIALRIPILPHVHEEGSESPQRRE